jgi:hypothetical protein
MNENSANEIDEFTYCDCECDCEENENEAYDCKCDCDCPSFEKTITINIHQIRKIKSHVPGVLITLPSKANTKRIPIHTPIKVRIPRGNIINSLPKGALRKTLSEPESLNLKTVSTGTIYICVLILPGAKVGKAPSNAKIPIRVKLEIEAANKIWQRQVNGKVQGVKFQIVDVVEFNENPSGIGGNSQSFPWNQKNIDKILFEHGRNLCPEADVYVYYMNGNSIGPIFPDGRQTDAITFRRLPVIIISNGALTKNYILAHELGHFMYINNLLGYKFDPDPFPGDPDHNLHPSNLMSPTSDFWPQKPFVTSAQIRKALNTRFFYE